MTISFFNPFHWIIETKTSPHALTLRSSFKDKLRGATTLFFGGFDYNKEGKLDAIMVGIFDICTLGIPLMILLGWDWCKNHENPFVKYFLGFFIRVLNVVFTIARILTALVFAYNPLTLIVTGIVHLISEFIAGGKELREAALSLQVTGKNLEKSSLRDELNREDMYHDNITPLPYADPIEALRINVVPGKSNAIEKLEIARAVQSKNKEGMFEHYNTPGDTSYHLPVFSPDGKCSVDANTGGLKELIRLNIGGVTAELEKTPEGEAILKNIMKLGG